MNVAKLALHQRHRQGDASARRGVEAPPARLQSQLDQLDARVRENAMKRLGMVMPSGDSVTYLDPLAHP